MIPLGKHIFGTMPAMLKLLVFSTFLSSPLASAEVMSNNCKNALVIHLKEAIDHNLDFAKIYTNFTKEESDQEEIKSIAYSLINIERISVLFLRPLDKKAREYQEKQIPVMCENVVPMSGARSTKELLPVEQRPKSFHQIDIKEISQTLKDYFEDKKYQEAYVYLSKTLEELEHYPEQLCLTRHFLESMARTIVLMPKHKELARESGLDDPSFLAEKFLSLQRIPLNYNYKLDKRAFKFQKEGISILCNDIPAIPWK